MKILPLFLPWKARNHGISNSFTNISSQNYQLLQVSLPYTLRGHIHDAKFSFYEKKVTKAYCRLKQ